MNSKSHLFLSFAKSLIRIAGCAATLMSGDVKYVLVLLVAAEILGIAEEVFDKR